jgi:ATP-dependent RNA helicase RhlB
MNSQVLSDQAFVDFDLPDSLLRGVEDASFKRCTPIQARTLPLALQGKDVAGQAQTGTGKTAAFLLATFNWMLRNEPVEGRRATQPRALILAPTRELAIQIHKDAKVLGAYTGFRLGLIYGGTGYDEQRQVLEEGVDVLIGTPGRIIDFFKQHLFDLKAAQVCVLDEADRMFDLGFIKDIRFLLRRMPPPEQRLNMLFSATLSYRVNELAYEHMNNPNLVKIETDSVVVERVRETIYYTANEEKIPLLIGVLRRMDATRTLVFVNTKVAADRVWSWLEGNGLRAAVLSGDVPQNKRERLLAKFQAGELPVLVATDVAARGLHIPDVSHVVNFDLPQDAEDYVHRIGRTARAGAAGDAVSFACETYAHSLLEIQEFIGHAIPSEKVVPELLVHPAPPVKIERRPRADGGRRPPRSGERTSAGGRPRSGSGGGEGRGRGRPPRRGDAGPRDRERSENQAAQSAAPHAELDRPADAGAPRKDKDRNDRGPRRDPETPAIG